MPYNAQSIENNNPIPPLAQFDLNNKQNNNNFNNNKQNNSYNSQMNNNYNNNNNDIYEISEQEKSFFKNIFDNKKEPNSERITAHNAIIIWKSNNADDNSIKIQANIIKPLENKGFLNLKEFQIACHLITISKKCNLPQKLPDILVNYLGRSNYNHYSNFNNYNTNDSSNSRMNTNSNVMEFFNNNNNNIDDSSFSIQNKQSSNSPFSNNYHGKSKNDRIQEILLKEEKLNKKNNIKKQN